MISSAHRFHGHRAIPALYSKSAKIIRAENLQIRYLPKKTTEFRGAVVVSKKTSKLAVTRNRIRRRTYEWIRINLPKDYRYDFMVSIFDESFATINYNELDQRLKQAFDKIK